MQPALSASMGSTEEQRAWIRRCVLHMQANCVVDIVPPPQQQQPPSATEQQPAQQRQAQPQQECALSAEVRWAGSVRQQRGIVADTWARVAAHAAEADDSKGVRCEAFPRLRVLTCTAGNAWAASSLRIAMLPAAA